MRLWSIAGDNRPLHADYQKEAFWAELDQRHSLVYDMHLPHAVQGKVDILVPNCRFLLQDILRQLPLHRGREFLRDMPATAAGMLILISHFEAFHDPKLDHIQHLIPELASAHMGSLNC